MTLRILVIVSVITILSCKNNQSENKEGITGKSDSLKPVYDSSKMKTANAFTIMHRKQVPILCYHRLREWKVTDSRRMKDYIVPPASFREQIKMLADSGYHTILPDELYAYLTTGTALPSRPIMLTFDDSEEEHLIIAAEEMKKYRFKGTFFIMTVAIGRPGYLNHDQIKQLSDQGNAIAAHTWDHHNVKQYEANDWIKQVEKPVHQLQSITGKPVKYFAYPFGLWNEPAIDHLKHYGFIAAFQLIEKRDEHEPLYTIRRMIIPGEWSSAQLMKRIKTNFN